MNWPKFLQRKENFENELAIDVVKKDFIEEITVLKNTYKKILDNAKELDYIDALVSDFRKFVSDRKVETINKHKEMKKEIIKI